MGFMRRTQETGMKVRLMRWGLHRALAIILTVTVAFSVLGGVTWLVTVQAPDSKLNFRNLLSGTLARLWTEDSALRLRSRMPALAGALAQDGGVALDDLTAHMPNQDWAEVTKEFFLS